MKKNRLYHMILFIPIIGAYLLYELSKNEYYYKRYYHSYYKYFYLFFLFLIYHVFASFVLGMMISKQF